MGIKFVPRLSAARGHANHGWLLSYHTFSFANYFDPDHMQFGPLRVINEDRVTPSEGFGKHSHREAEIWSYVVSGELEHKDSLGNTEIMKRGDLQMTSTGTGIAHSEYNRNDKMGVHFCQIWATPNKRGLKPSYYTRHYTDEQKQDKLCKVVAPIEAADAKDERETDGPAPVNADLTMYASILNQGKEISHLVSTSTTKLYLHLIMTSGYRSPKESAASNSAKLVVSSGGNSTELTEGDGLYMHVQGDAGELDIKSVGESGAEFLLFELS